ncbi:hypothetical protein E2562_034455 [Oryza meyeriana var. granulata]|uniref:Uncharacterized protein n=1 Tax=Oryza meyeriana var. granulata TaxID=110450 RepID=A0A6G1CW98_9ORYZ|nr:hypothetical protein E2562_034455 [Oryza meyeriana var. granulata]
MGGASPSPSSTSTRRKPAAFPSDSSSAAPLLAQLLDWRTVSDAALLRPTCSTECLVLADTKNR